MECPFCFKPIEEEDLWEAIDYDDRRLGELDCPWCNKLLIVGVQVEYEFYVENEDD